MTASPPSHDVSFLDDLAPDLDGRISYGDSERANRAGDWSTPVDEEVTPDVVVWPHSTEDVSRVLAAANDRGVPVTPYAAGTGLEGNATPVERGISLDTTEMDAILEVRPDDLQIDVQAGVIGSDVDEAVASHGLFFPPLPSSGDFSTVGGMIATGASGMQTVKYGTVADWTLELEAVLADGTVVSLGSRAVKSSSGYNLRDVVVGSEGTLAVVTAATLRLSGIPHQKRGGRAVFDSLDDATTAISDAVTSGVDVAKIELVDEQAATVVNAYSGTDLPDAPTVFVEFHADHGIDEEVQFCRAIFESHDVRSFEVSADESEMADLWQARKDFGFATEDWDPDLDATHPGDVAVPISEYPALVRYIRELADERDLLAPAVGHAGDGNVHWVAIVDRDDPDETAKVDDLYRRVVEFAIDCGGTATGEHGVGRGKREFLVAEHGAGTVRAMKALKDALDPKGTLNPGKVFPDGDPATWGDGA